MALFKQISAIASLFVCANANYQDGSQKQYPNRLGPMPADDGGLWQELTQKRSEIFDTAALNEIYSQAYEMFQVMSQEESYMAEVNKQHTVSGALRSGEGHANTVANRVRLFEESERLDEIEEAGEIVTDMHLQEELFKRYQKNMNKNYGSFANDELDLTDLFTPDDAEYGTLFSLVDPEAYTASQASLSQDKRIGRALRTNEKQDIGQQKKQSQASQKIKKLEEPYPTSCQNHGQLQPQVQTVYMCRNLQGQKRNSFRVTKELFKDMLRNPDYKCTMRNQTNNVCVCPRGFGDYQCSTKLYKKCFLNITEPAFFKGCQERKDTPYYLYSLPGYDPCEYLDFTKSYEVKFSVHCSTIDENGVTTMTKDHTGYNYRDVVQSPQFDPFNYVATNPETQFALVEEEEYPVVFEFRDFKYLSKSLKFKTTVRDPLVMVGLKNASVEIDFSAMLASDATGQSRYINGGRLYFEANLFGYQTNSFTTKGFFDQLGYVEPERALLPTQDDLQKYRRELTYLGIIIGFIIFRSLYVNLCRSNSYEEDKYGNDGQKAKTD